MQNHKHKYPNKKAKMQQVQQKLNKKQLKAIAAQIHALKVDADSDSDAGTDSKAKANQKNPVLAKQKLKK